MPGIRPWTRIGARHHQLVSRTINHAVTHRQPDSIVAQHIRNKRRGGNSGAGENRFTHRRATEQHSAIGKQAALTIREGVLRDVNILNV